MSDDIELGLLNQTPSTSSETLFDRSRVHKGYGASKIPIKPSATAGFAGQQYQHIFEGQLGQAASQSDIFGLKKSHDQNLDTQRILESEHNAGNILTREEIKPSQLNWNKALRKQYPKHWQQVKAWKQRHPLPIKKGLTLPFSNNIGPGNSIQPALTRSDSIAAGHDLHYEHSKSNQEVLSADREAISHFAYEAVNPENPISQLQAGVGLLGLGAKNTVESLSGKVYYGKYVSSIS